MARSKGRSGGGRRSGGSGGGSRRAAAEPAVADEIEVVEEDGGAGIDDGILVVTGIALLAALICIDYARGASHGAGILFKGAYTAPADAGGSGGADTTATAPEEDGE